MDSQALRTSVLNESIDPQPVSRRAQLHAVPARDHAVLSMPEAGIDSILEVIGNARRRIYVKPSLPARNLPSVHLRWSV